MKNYNKKKVLTISVLAVAAVLLAGGLWVYVDSMGNSEPASIVGNDTTQEPDGSEAPDIKIPINSEQNTQTGKTDSAGSGATPSAESTPSVTGSGSSGQTKTSDDKPKTPAEATPPPTPETDHEPSSSTAPSSSTPTPAKPETSIPQSGDKKDGKIYVPGFGWVEDEGGGVEVDDTDNGAHNGNKVGDM